MWIFYIIFLFKEIDNLSVKNFSILEIVRVDLVVGGKFIVSMWLVNFGI